MNRLSILPILLFGLVIAPTAVADIYKWVDSDGNVHYGDCPPADCEPEKMQLAPAPSQQEIEEAQRRLDRLRQSAGEAQERRDEDSELVEPKPVEKPPLGLALDPDCFTPVTNSWAGRITDTREQVLRQPLADIELRQLIELLRGLTGRWDGTIQDIACVNPAAELPVQTHRYRFRLNSRWQADQIFRMAADVDGIDTRQVFEQFFWLLPSRDGLRFRTANSNISFELDQPGNDVEILSAANNQLTFFWRRGGAVRRVNVFALQKVRRDFTIREFFYVQGTLAGKRIWKIEK
jgi:hypothetical protein